MSERKVLQLGELPVRLDGCGVAVTYGGIASLIPQEGRYPVLLNLFHPNYGGASRETHWLPASCREKELEEDAEVCPTPCSVKVKGVSGGACTVKFLSFSEHALTFEVEGDGQGMAPKSD